MMRALSWPLAALCLAGACRQAPAGESRDFERMRRQARYDPYDTSRFFTNGSTMQAPPAHTIARESATRTALSAAVGGRQFAISCAVCHGIGGFGGGPMAPNLQQKRPPSLRSATVAAMRDSDIVQIMTNGHGLMPPLGWQIAPDVRVAIAEYVHTLRRLPSTAETRADSALAASLARLDSLNAAAEATVKPQ